MVEIEEGDGGYLRKERLQHGRVGCYDRLEQTEARIMLALWLLAPSRAGRGGDGSRGVVVVVVVVVTGVGVPEEIRLALLLRAHAALGRQQRRRRRGRQMEALSQLRPYEAILTDEAARKHTKETCRRKVGASAAPVMVSESSTAWWEARVVACVLCGA